MILDQTLVARCARAWIRTNRHIALSRDGGGGGGPCTHATPDDVLRQAGITFDSDPELYCAYESEIRRIAKGEPVIRRPPLTDSDRVRIRQLHRLGLTYARISEATGRGTATVSRVVRGVA